MDRDESVGADVEKGIEAMESGVEEMAQRAGKLGERVDDARADWKQKQQDSGVPGAEPPDEQSASAVIDRSDASPADEDASHDAKPSAHDRRPDVEDER